MSSAAELDYLPSDRERVVEAMTELCAARGYEETSIEAVRERAGVSEESLERMFGAEKEACLLAAVKAILGETIGAVSAVYSADRPDWDNALLGIKAILELMAANPSYARLGYVVSRQLGPPEARALYDAGLRMLAAMIERLHEFTEADPPPSASRGAVGSAEAVVRREISAGRAEGLPRFLPDFIYGATVGFVGQQEALALAARGRVLLEGTAWA